jgi:putative component of membrane protein insertase Oxa1/YidC/SpoIIIJ protein YidD
MFIRKAIFIVFILFLTASGSDAAGGRWEEPWPKETSGGRAKEEARAGSLSSGQRAVGGLFRFFQEYISPVDGDRCPSYPTCSQYAQEAVRKHGVLIGLVMTFDRLLHESDETRRAPLIRAGDSYRYYDPVENNDFWWSKK